LAKYAKIVNMETVKLDKFGRVHIPKAMRDALKIDKQQELHLSIENGAFVLTPTPTVVDKPVIDKPVIDKPVIDKPVVVKMVDGFPLLEVEHIDNALEHIRQERDKRLSGL
jgi:bifunctional DNA-binding transcriptional regulator/antitoxin component of YhaV-PrlF toxin-antitoxin module